MVKILATHRPNLALTISLLVYRGISHERTFRKCEGCWEDKEKGREEQWEGKSVKKRDAGLLVGKEVSACREERREQCQ